MMVLRIFAFGVLLTPLPSLAASLEARDLRTSDQIKLQEVSLAESFSEQSWTAGAGLVRTQFARGENELSLVRLQHRPAELSAWSFEAGLARIEADSESRDLGFGGVQYKSHPGLSFVLVQLSRQLPASRASLREASGSFLTEDELSVTLSALLADVWRPSLLMRGSKWSDDNEKRFADFSLMYGLSTGWPWMWVGYGAFTQSFRSQEAAYWSPAQFQSHGPRVDLSFPIKGIWSAFFALNINHYDEDGFRGTGSYGVAGVQAQWQQGSGAKLGFTQIRSGQSSTPWSSDEVQFSLTHRF